MLGDLFSANSLGLIICILLGAYGLYMQYLLPLFKSWLPQREPTEWILDYEDVLEARALLNALGLPMELALKILEDAEYWPTREFSTEPGKTVKVAATMFRSSAAGLCFDADVFKEYDVLWTQYAHEGNEGSGTGDGFLDELKDGDRLLIWARAKVRVCP